jgi:hypothetical protein
VEFPVGRLKGTVLTGAGSDIVLLIGMGSVCTALDVPEYFGNTSDPPTLLARVSSIRNARLAEVSTMFH